MVDIEAGVDALQNSQLLDSSPHTTSRHATGTQSRTMYANTPTGTPIRQHDAHDAEYSGWQVGGWVGVNALLTQKRAQRWCECAAAALFTP